MSTYYEPDIMVGALITTVNKINFFSQQSLDSS